MIWAASAASCVPVADVSLADTRRTECGEGVCQNDVVHERLQAGWPTYRYLVSQAPSTIPSSDRGVVGLGGLRIELNEGGFRQYFSSPEGGLAETLISWVGNHHPDLAALVQEAVRMVGDPYPAEQQERQDRLRHLPADAFQSLDEKYRLIEVATDLDRVLDGFAESRFMVSLEQRIFAEMHESGRRDLSGLSCDGLYFTVYALDEEPPRLEGEMYTGRSGQELWSIALYAPHDRAKQALDEHLWDPLLPAVGITGWLAVDPGKETIRVDLSKSEPVDHRFKVNPRTGRVTPVEHPPHRPTD